MNTKLTPTAAVIQGLLELIQHAAGNGFDVHPDRDPSVTQARALLNWLQAEPQREDWSLPEACDSPTICQVHGACAGRYGTRAICQSPQPVRHPAQVPQATDEHADAVLSAAQSYGEACGHGDASECADAYKRVSDAVDTMISVLIAHQSHPSDSRPVRFIGCDPLALTSGAVLPMVFDSWRFGFYEQGGVLCFGHRDEGELVATEATNRQASALYERLHSMSKVLEGSGRLDEREHPDAYATVLDAMAFVMAFMNQGLTQHLLSMIENISNALGISAEDQACANGDLEILAAISSLKASATPSKSKD
jgi:hypothetical protein